MIKTGYKEIDLINKGFENKKLYTLASRPALGKTNLALNMLINMTLLGYKAHYISTTSSTFDIKSRLASILSGIRYKRKRSEMENEILKRGINEINSLDLNVYNYDEVISIKHYLDRFSNEMDILFIDDLDGIINLNSNRLEVIDIVKTIKSYCLEYNIPIILISSVSRRVERRKDKVPRSGDLYYANILFKYVDKIILLYRNQYHEGIPSVDKESALVIVTDPKVTDYRGVYLEYNNQAGRFYSKLAEQLYLDYSNQFIYFNEIRQN